MTMGETNNVERRVRTLEQEIAVLKEKCSAMERYLEVNEQAHTSINGHLARIEVDIHLMQRMLDRTTTKVSIMVVGASIVVSSILMVVHYATR